MDKKQKVKASFNIKGSPVIQLSWQIMTHFEISSQVSWKLTVEPGTKLKTQCSWNTISWLQFTYTNWIQNFYCCQAPISLVSYLVDLAICSFTYGLYNFPGICGIWKRFKSKHRGVVMKQSIQMFPGGEISLLCATDHRFGGSRLSKWEYIYFFTSNLMVLSFHFPFLF